MKTYGTINTDLLGLDIHGDRGDQNFKAWYDRGVRYVAFKVCEGATFRDKLGTGRAGRERIKAIEDAGLIVLGGYAFLYPEDGSDWLAEADFYLKLCDEIGIDWDKTWALPDLERRGPSPEGPWLHNWCDHVAKHSGRDQFATPGSIYSGYYFWRDEVDGYPAPPRWGRWMPWYKRTTWPSADQFKEFSFPDKPKKQLWQDSETAWGGYDRNRYRGTAADLKREMTRKRGATRRRGDDHGAREARRKAGAR